MDKDYFANFDFVGDANEQLEKFFRDRKWPFTKKTHFVYSLYHKGKNAIYPCVAEIVGSPGYFVFYTFAQAPMSENNHLTFLQQVTQINATLKSGNFEIDNETSELKFRNSVFFGQSPLLNHEIEFTISHSLKLMDKYYPEFQRLSHPQEN